MGYINFKNNLFIGKEELDTFQQISNKDLYKILGFLTKNYGFTGNSDLLNSTNNSFVVSNAGTMLIQINNPSYAFAYPNNLITWDRNENITVPDTYKGKNVWVKASYMETYIEKGKITLSSNGQITGTNTEFTKKLRGEPAFSSKIALFTYENNIYTKVDEYIVEYVVDDTTAKIYNYIGGVGTIGTYYYAVVGTFAQGVTILESDKFPFRYDGCKIEFVEETSTNVPPEEEIIKSSNTSFYIARLIITSEGNITVEDKRNVFESEGEIYSKWWSLK